MLICLFFIIIQLKIFSNFLCDFLDPWIKHLICELQWLPITKVAKTLTLHRLFQLYFPIAVTCWTCQHLLPLTGLPGQQTTAHMPSHCVSNQKHLIVSNCGIYVPELLLSSVLVTVKPPHQIHTKPIGSYSIYDVSLMVLTTISK